MVDLRTLGDKLETMVADDLWPLPDLPRDAVHQVSRAIPGVTREPPALVRGLFHSVCRRCAPRRLSGEARRLNAAPSAR